VAVSIYNGFTWVNDIRSNGNMLMGKGSSNSWTYNSKTNLVVGQIAGNYNVFSTGVNIIYDQDIFDTDINENEIKPSIGPSII